MNRSPQRTGSISSSVFTMLDTFEILTTSGVVLWSRTYATVSPVVINSFISDVFIEEKSTTGTKGGQSASSNPPYKYDQHTLRWTFVKELGVIFVVSSAPLLNVSGPFVAGHKN